MYQKDYILFPPEVVKQYIETYVTTDYKFSTDGEWININSEFTSDDKYRMGFNLAKNFVNDFKSGVTMSLMKFVEEHEDIDYLKAERLLTGIGLKLKKTFKKINVDDLEERHIAAVDSPALKIIPELKEFSENMSYSGKKIYDYILSRKLADKHIEKYHLMYSDNKKCSLCYGEGYTEDEDICPLCNGSGKNYFYNRLIIPTYENGKLVYLQGRTIKDDPNELRYQNIKSPRMQIVYFYDLLQENSDIYIMEGPIDAMTMFDYNTTALLNTKISDPQVEKILKKNPKRIIFVSDYDETLAKRNKVKLALSKNIQKFMKASEGKVPIGLYEWDRMLIDNHKEVKKDINANNITFVNENYITIFNPLSIQMVTDNANSNENNE